MYNVSLKLILFSSIVGAGLMIYDDVYCGVTVPILWVLILPLITTMSSLVLYLLIRSDW